MTDYTGIKDRDENTNIEENFIYDLYRKNNSYYIIHESDIQTVIGHIQYWTCVIKHQFSSILKTK